MGGSIMLAGFENLTLRTLLRVGPWPHFVVRR
jgi:hypothetical protein